MQANDLQVGGEHYKNGSAVQHWDLMEKYNYPYLEGQISKYILRAHLKNGIQDLDKACHFTMKCLENTRLHGERVNKPNGYATEEELDSLMDAQGLSHEPLRMAVKIVLCGLDSLQLEGVIAIIQSARDELYPQ